MARPVGRPKKDINPEQVKQLAMIQCTGEEMAAVLGCSVDTLDRNFAEIIKEGKLHGKMSLRRKQFQLAMDGNVGMIIWLSKQFLGQSDRVEVENTHEIKGAASPVLKLSTEQLEEALRNLSAIDATPTSTPQLEAAD